MRNSLVEIYNQVFKSLGLAVNTKDENTIMSFISFFRKIIAQSIEYNRINEFERFIDFAYRIYVLIAKQRGNGEFRILEDLAGVLPLHLREMITLVSINAPSLEKQVDRTAVNAFYRLGFQSFNTFFYMQTKFHDWKLLESSINKFGQLNSDFSSLNIKKSELKQLEENSDEKEDEKVKQIKLDIAEHGKFNDYKRHIVIVLKYWIYELFEHGKIPPKDAHRILKALDRLRMDNNDAQDLLFLRQQDLFRYMGWESWEFEERPEGVQIDHLGARDWITKGFIIDRIRLSKQTFIFDKSQAEADEIRWFYEEAVSIIKDMVVNPTIWRNILSSDQLSNMNDFTRRLIEAIGISKRSKLQEKDIQIAEAKLSHERVLEFTEAVGDRWDAELRMRRLFNFFNNSKDLTGKQEKLMRVGPNIFLDKGKIMFLDDESYMKIYGLEDIGIRVARSEDDLFFERILSTNAEKIHKSKFFELLSASIKNLRDRGVEPNVILISPDFLYEDETLVNSEKFGKVSSDHCFPNNINFFVTGTFDGITLFSSYSQMLRNKTVVCKFEDAFEMLYKTNEKWFKNILSVNVEEVSDQHALDKFNQQQEKWMRTDEGELLSEEDALTLIKTSIIIDVETIVDFKVKNNAYFVIGEIGR